MPSTLTWLDHDAAARERSLRILALYRERESRDELGIGGIRDALADLLFPGTSTIQTRLAYMLFVPWIYQRLESRQVPSSRIRVQAQRTEAELVAPLTRRGDDAGEQIYGVIGRLAKSALKRFPSSVYWLGLGRWGIRRFDGSQEQYHRGVDAIYVRRANRRKRDDDESVGLRGLDTWHPKLPTPPKTFPDDASFVLRAEDAEFLRDRMLTSCAGSLLAWLVQNRPDTDAAFPWLHPEIANAPEANRALLEHARRFSLAVHGAALLYNLQLAELRESNERVEAYRTALAEWADEVSGPTLRAWRMDDFFGAVRQGGHTMSTRTEAFVSEWVAVAQHQRGRVADHGPARELVKQREQGLKGNRSRFTNRAALGQWSGAAGVARLDYRWGTVKTFLADLALVEGQPDA